MPLNPLLASHIIECLWGVFCLYWLINAFGNKRIVYRQPLRGRLLYFLAIIVFFWLMMPTQYFYAPLFSESLATQIAGIFLCAAGFAIAIWARRILGTNWSGRVTLKENHELIRTGPYRFVRHPIYTGIILAATGSALAIMPNIAGIAWVIFAIIMFRIKSLQEEKLMLRQFPETYPQYMHQTKALIPFIY